MQPRFYSCVVFIPIITIGTIVFWSYRNVFPISDRVPWLGVAIGMIVALFCVAYIADDDDDLDRACSRTTLTGTLICIPMAIYCFALKAFLLLWRFEITQDVQGRERKRARNTSYVSSDHHSDTPLTAATGDVVHEPFSPSLASPSSPKPATTTTTAVTSQTPDFKSPKHQHHHTMMNVSWYTRHHYLARPRAVGIMTAIVTSTCLIPFVIIAIVVDPDPVTCTPNEGGTGAATYLCVTYAAIWAISIVILGIKLAKHGRDSLGLKSELRCVAVIVLSCCFIGWPTVVLAFKNDTLWPVILSSCGFFAWGANALWPLYLACRYQRRQRKLMAHMQSFRSLADFLRDPDCCAAFATFVGAEFSGENLSFYLKAINFKHTGGMAPKREGVTIDAPDRIILLTHPSSATTAPAPAAVTGAAGIATSASSAASTPTAAVAAAMIAAKKHAIKISPTSRALREAYAIHRAFIVAGAQYEINISSATKVRCANTLAHLTTAVATAARTAATATSAATPHHGRTIGINRMSLPVASSSTAHDDADVVLLHNILQVFDEAIDEVLRLMSQNSYARFLASKAYRTLLAHLQQKHQDDDQSTRSRAGSADEMAHGGTGTPGGMVAISPPLVPLQPPPSSSMVVHAPPLDLRLSHTQSATNATTTTTNNNNNRSHSNHSPMHAWTTRPTAAAATAIGGGTAVIATSNNPHAVPPRVKSPALASHHSSSIASPQPVPITATTTL